MNKFIGKILLIASLFLMAPLALHAQKDALESAKTALSSKKYADAEKQIVKAQEHADTKSNPETWYVAGKIQYGKSDEQLKKAYLGKAYDTLIIYNSALNMCRDFLRCDSLAQIPDSKGRVHNKYRKDAAKLATEVRGNLMNGGIYYYNKSDNDTTNARKALAFFGMYVDVVQSPMMGHRKLSDADSLNLTRTAYYACLSAVKVRDNEAVIDYYNKAAHLYREHGDLAALYCSQAYRALDMNDSVQSVLTRALEAYPKNDALFAALTYHYATQREYVKAINLCDDMIKLNDSNYLYYYVKGYLLFSIREYDGALRMYKEAARLNPDYAEAYSNIGLIYRIKAQDYADSSTKDVNDPNYRRDQQIITDYYQQARTNYEEARRLSPDNKALWLDGLYSVYYNLKMGREFAEIESLR